MSVLILVLWSWEKKNIS